MPKIVEVNDFSRRIEIKIAINKYTTPWYGDIEFIPGNGYSIRPIL